jgi:hypothetical protein
MHSLILAAPPFGLLDWKRSRISSLKKQKDTWIPFEVSSRQKDGRAGLVYSKDVYMMQV